MHHIYILKVIPRLVKDSAWTEADNAIVGRHFVKLQELQEAGKLIMAGRTTFEGEDSFGVVVIKADKEEAKQIMLSDPAIDEGIMTGKLYPYQVALISEKNI